MQLGQFYCSQGMFFGFLFHWTQVIVVLFSWSVDAATPMMSIHNKQQRWLPSHRSLIELHPKTGFSWQRFLHETTGIASSKETSSFILKPPRNNKTSIHSTFTTAEQLFASYVSWLARPTITLGVLRKVSLPHSGETAIQLRWLANLLCFGPPRSVKNVSQKWVTTSFPVTGGLLALSDSTKSRGGAVRSDDNDADMGALCLTLFRENGPLGSNRDKSSRFIIHTELVGCRPSLAGHPPIHPFRKWIYLSTQSMVHGYVMWRFHRHLVHEILKTELTTVSA